MYTSHLHGIKVYEKFGFPYAIYSIGYCAHNAFLCKYSIMYYKYC